MELFDGIIKETTENTAALVSKTWDFDAADTWECSERSELIMQRDQAFELGGSGTSSANFTCPLHRAQAGHDGPERGPSDSQPRSL